MTWQTRAAARCLRWTSTPTFDLVEAEHDGYRRLPRPVTHRRAVAYVKPDVWIIYDRLLDSGGDHDVEWFLHLRPDCTIAPSEPEKQERVFTAPMGARLRFFWSVIAGPGADGADLRCETLDDAFSDTYGKQVQAPTLRIRHAARRGSKGDWALLAWFTASTEVVLQARADPVGLRLNVTRPGSPQFHVVISNAR